MVRFLVKVGWLVSLFGVGHVFTVGQVERDVEKVYKFFGWLCMD